MFKHKNSLNPPKLQYGLTRDELDTLGRYNAEVARGIIHTTEWTDEMAVLQHTYDEEVSRSFQEAYHQDFIDHEVLGG